MITKLEYVWLDGNNPQQLRSKTKIVKLEGRLENIFVSYKKGETSAPTWNFDGSSTNQASTDKSELLLKPVNYFLDPFRKDGIIVMCEVMNVDGTPHKTNTRSNMVELVNKYDDKSNMGWEQEFFIIDNKTEKPLGWPKDGFPRPQGDYYCGVGGNNVWGKDFVEEAVDLMLRAGLEVGGINAEVAAGQYEYQIGRVDAIDGADQLWISRYILCKLSEKYDYSINFDPKPFKGNEWNGSGMHVNFSTETLRKDKVNKKQIAIEYCELLKKTHKEHIAVYGVNNEHRLTGKNETSSMEKFGWGIGDRTKSIRIPSSIEDFNAVGYIEDRRPASNADPYLIVGKLMESICSKVSKPQVV